MDYKTLREIRDYQDVFTLPRRYWRTSQTVLWPNVGSGAGTSFKVGDRVISLVSDSGYGVVVGDYGDIVGISTFSNFSGKYLVRFGPALSIYMHEKELALDGSSLVHRNGTLTLPTGIGAVATALECIAEASFEDASRALTQHWKEEGRCPQCGELGRYINLGATCSIHGGY